MTPYRWWFRLFQRTDYCAKQAKSFLTNGGGFDNLHIIGHCDPTKPLPPDTHLTRVSPLARCLLCGLYVTPESARPHFANCHPEVTYAVARDAD